MKIIEMSEEIILSARVADGDERAFRKLFEIHCNNLGNYVYATTKSIEVSEEIVQDTFVKVWLKRQKLRNVKNFRSYLFTLCKNEMIDQLRKKAKEAVYHSRLESHLRETEMEIPAETEIDQYRVLIDKAIDKLPPQAKKVYLLSRHERLKHDQIASELSISQETVKKHIQFAVSFIKKDVLRNIDLVVVVILTTSLSNECFYALT